MNASYNKEIVLEADTYGFGAMVNGDFAKGDFTNWQMDEQMKEFLL